MDKELEAGGVEECKSFSRPTVPTTNGAPPRVPFSLLVSNTPTASPSRRTQTEDLGLAGAIRSAEMVKMARFARCQKIKRASACIRLTKDVQWGDHSCNTWTPPVLSGEHVILCMESAVMRSRLIFGS